MGPEMRFPGGVVGLFGRAVGVAGSAVAEDAGAPDALPTGAAEAVLEGAALGGADALGAEDAAVVAAACEVEVGAAPKWGADGCDAAGPEGGSAGHRSTVSRPPTSATPVTTAQRSPLGRRRRPAEVQEACVLAEPNGGGAEGTSLAGARSGPDEE